MPNPYQVVRDFETALCEYTGAGYAVTTNSCTNALLLACAWNKLSRSAEALCPGELRPCATIPKHTYVGVPMSIKHAGFDVAFYNGVWRGEYQLIGTSVWDCARRFSSDMYRAWSYQCVSFHWSKILGLGHGGAILHDNPDADRWLRKARFDGRTEGVHPRDDSITLGWHCPMSPEVAAHGLVKLSWLPKDNDDLPNSDYPDLSIMECFR